MKVISNAKEKSSLIRTHDKILMNLVYKVRKSCIQIGTLKTFVKMIANMQTMSGVLLKCPV